MSSLGRYAIVVGLALPSVALAQQDPQQQPPPPRQQRPYYPPQPYGYPPAPPKPRLVLPSANPEAVALTWTCADAIDNRRLDAARAKCGDALGRDESIAFAHFLLAQAEPPDLARVELSR